MARSRSKSSELGAFRISSAMFAVGYSLPMAGVISSNLKVASRAPVFVKGAAFLLLVVCPFGGGCELTGRIAPGAITTISPCLYPNNERLEVDDYREKQ